MRYIISAILASLALPAGADVPGVITDIPPVQSLVAQVMGDLGTPGMLLERGADEHDFQLRPSQMAALSTAGLVVWVGPDLTPWLERALSGVDAPRLMLLGAPGTVERQFPDGAADPHAWLDPDSAKAWLGLVAAELARLDPANAAVYADNAAAALARTTTLDATLAALLAPVKDRPFVTQHDAYRYFADHFGLSFAGSIAVGDATDPGAARLRALEAQIRDEQVPCLFPEAQHDPTQITQIAAATGSRVGPALDPAGSLLDPGPSAYEALMTALATSLVQCLAQ